jgi:hypothetical protein
MKQTKRLRRVRNQNVEKLNQVVTCSRREEISTTHSKSLLPAQYNTTQDDGAFVDDSDGCGRVKISAFEFLVRAVRRSQALSTKFFVESYTNRL